jgi:hypothetical protein
MNLRSSLLFAILFAVIGAATEHADIVFSSPLSFTVWTGTSVTASAELPSPALLPTAFFQYAGPIDFATGSSDTFGEFFGSHSGGITGFTSPTLTLSEFLALAMSDTSGTNTYIEISGFYTASSNTSIGVMHTDGASLYTGIGFTNTVFSDPSAGGFNEALFPAGTGVPFLLVYVDTNGAPASLQVPEPGSAALLGTALLLCGLVAFASRRRS